jgi:hypothetical protein
MFTACAVSVLLVAPAVSQPYEAMGEVGDWKVFFNEESGGCFVERQTEDGVVMQMGTEAAMLSEDGNNYGFIAVYVPVLTEIQPGETRPVRFQLGDTTYGGDAVGAARDGYFGGYAVANSRSFIDDVANLQTMTVNPDTDRSLEIDLTGTKAALEALRACQSEKSG